MVRDHLWEASNLTTGYSDKSLECPCMSVTHKPSNQSVSALNSSPKKDWPTYMQSVRILRLVITSSVPE